MTGYAPAALGALGAALVAAWRLRTLPLRPRTSMAFGAGAAGFLVGAIARIGPYPEALSFAAAFLPAVLVFVAGFDRERLSHELARLEGSSDDPEARPRVIARATEIRDEARASARSLDPEARTSPAHSGDARAVYAYAAQVIAYARALDGAHRDAAAALGEVPVPWMPAAMRPLMVGNLAFFHVCAGDAGAALEALDRLPEAKAVAEHRAVLRAARAAALVRLNRAEEALAIVGRSDAEGLPPDRLRPRYAILRAAALTSLGEADAARAAIDAVLDLPEAVAELRRYRPAVPAEAASILDAALASRPE